MDLQHYQYKKPAKTHSIKFNSGLFLVVCSIWQVPKFRLDFPLIEWLTGSLSGVSSKSDSRSSFIRQKLKTVFSNQFLTWQLSNLYNGVMISLYRSYLVFKTSMTAYLYLFILMCISWKLSYLTPNPIKSSTIRIRSPRIRKTCEDGTGAAGIGRRVVVVVVVGVSVVVVVVVNIEDFSVLADVGSTVVLDM